MVEIGAQDERPSPGSEASEAAGARTESTTDTASEAGGARTESTTDTVKLAKISRDPADAGAADEKRSDSPRSLSPSGTLRPDDADSPQPPARVPSSAPTVTAKSQAGSAETPSRAGASPSGAWPADARPISLTDSVFTPWSARLAPQSDSPHSASTADPQDSSSETTAPSAKLRNQASASEPLSGPKPPVARPSDEAADQTGLGEVPSGKDQPGSARAEQSAQPPAGAAEVSADDPSGSPAPEPAWTAAPASPVGTAEAIAAPAWRANPTAAGGPLAGRETPDAGNPTSAAGSPGGGGYGGGQGDSGPSRPAGPILPAGRRRFGPVVGIAVAVAGLVIGGGIYLYVQKPSPAHAAGQQPAKSHSPVPKVPVQVVSITPADGATAVNGAAEIRVEFSAPLSPGSPMPTLKPKIDGTWQQDGNAAVFVPDRGFRPRTKVTVKVPGGGTGVTSTNGGLLAAPVTAKF
ncbi:MAG: Ig-like domain-containing protein, partial [Streptosporangiaceae bacterium]